MGMHVYDIDPAISSVADVRAFLSESQCKMVVFPPVTETHDNLRALRYAIPELYECEYMISTIPVFDTSRLIPCGVSRDLSRHLLSFHLSDSNEFGQHFHSKHFPKLKYFVHTGFDIEVGKNMSSILIFRIHQYYSSVVVAVGTVTFKSLFFKDPIVSKIDTEVKGTSDDLACYTKISLGTTEMHVPWH